MKKYQLKYDNGTNEPKSIIMKQSDTILEIIEYMVLNYNKHNFKYYSVWMDGKVLE